MNRDRLAIFIAILAFSSITHSASEEIQVSELYAKILANDTSEFIEKLSAIDNLNVIASQVEGESLLCAATSKDREVFLENLLIFGANPNHRHPNVSIYYRLPALCAISRNNLKALELLDSYGADLEAKINTELELKYHRSILSLAVVSRRYFHADYIMQRTEIDDAERKAIEYSVGKYDFSEFPELDALSLKFVIFLESGATNYAEFSETYNP